jgi:hypothetical protein
VSLKVELEQVRMSDSRVDNRSGSCKKFESTGQLTEKGVDECKDPTYEGYRSYLGRQGWQRRNECCGWSGSRIISLEEEQTFELIKYSPFSANDVEHLRVVLGIDFATSS